METQPGRQPEMSRQRHTAETILLPATCSESGAVTWKNVGGCKYRLYTD
jgi:hypothetical protein